MLNKEQTKETDLNAKLNPDEEVSIEQLENIDFTQKPESLKALDSTIISDSEARRLSAENPFSGLFILTYKGAGPIEHVFFYSDRVSPVITRDCQIWCKSKGFRYIAFKPALINLMDMDSGMSMQSVPAGDITELVTAQSRRLSASGI